MRPSKVLMRSRAQEMPSPRLAHGFGLQSRHAPRMEQGIAEHTAWQEVARTSSRSARRGVVLMLVALLGLLLWFWLGG